MIYATIRYSVPEVAAEPCKDAVRELVQHVHEHEDSTLRYTVLVDADQGQCHFMHLGAFENRDALEAHQESDAMKMFLDLVYPETARGMDIRTQTVVGRIEPKPSTVKM